LSQIGTRVIAGLIVAALVAVWGLIYVSPHPNANIKKSSDSKSAEITITNTGLLPASKDYSIVSPANVTTTTTVRTGKEYVSEEKPPKENVKFFKVNNLPRDAIIKIIVEGSDQISIE